MGVSYTSLRDGFALLGIQPQDAKWFMRIVRALTKERGRTEHLESALTLGDTRTLRTQMQRAGLQMKGASEPVTFEQFLAVQRFISIDQPLIRSLRDLAMRL